MEKSNLHEEYNMKLAAISILYSVISDLKKKVSKLQNESNEIMDKISNEGIRENEKEFCTACKSKNIMSYTPMDDICNDCGHVFQNS